MNTIVGFEQVEAREFEQVEDPEFEQTDITFTFQCGSLTARVTYTEPYLCTIEQWENLFNGKECELSFCSCNGEVSITSNNSKIYFNVSKYGSGGDGDTTICVDFIDCKAAFSACRQYISVMKYNSSVMKYNSSDESDD